MTDLLVIVGIYIYLWLWGGRRPLDNDCDVCAYDNDWWPLLPGADHQWSQWSPPEQLSRVSAFLQFTPLTMDSLNITHLNLMVLNQFYKQMLEGILTLWLKYIFSEIIISCLRPMWASDWQTELWLLPWNVPCVLSPSISPTQVSSLLLLARQASQASSWLSHRLRLWSELQHDFFR